MTFTERHRRAAGALALLIMLVLAGASTVAGEQAADDDGLPVKQIKMFAENWKWTPAIIRAQPGQKISIEIQNVDSPHAFEIKKLDMKFALPEGETTLVEIVAPTKPGTYRWRCARPCGNGCAKMTGKLIIEEP